MHALLDGDVICYACGFASDAAARGMGLEYEPWHHQKHGVNMKLKAVLDRVDATRSTIFLSHPVNFREHLFPDYKANRDPNAKPYWYAEIKEYLLDKGAVFAEQGDEADDALAIAQTEAFNKNKTTIICTNDKDLDMIPGLHYNWSKTREANGAYFVDEVEGLRHFYTQMITGDSTDNIPGLFRHTGQKATAKHKDPLDFMYTEAEMYQHVLEVYDGDSEFLHKIAPLLWIKRRKGEVWRPPV